MERQGQNARPYAETTLEFTEMNAINEITPQTRPDH
jgi:hypothetical protein